MNTDRLTEILNFLCAVSRDIDAFRVAMNAFRAETNSRLGNVEARLAAFESRLARVEARLGGLTTDTNALRAEVRVLAHQFYRPGSRELEIRAGEAGDGGRVVALEGRQT